MTHVRGNFIPPVSDYAHWNEDAYAMWYEENKYDMARWDEPIDDPYDDDIRDRWDGPEPFEDSFDTEEEARAFAGTLRDSAKSITSWGPPGKVLWYVEHYDTEAHERWLNLD